jgi:hypothetical protein
MFPDTVLNYKTAVVGSGMPPKGHGFRVALVEGGGAIKRWDLLGKLLVTELIP